MPQMSVAEEKLLLNCNKLGKGYYHQSGPIRK